MRNASIALLASAALGGHGVQPRAAGAQIMYVDVASVGGACSDARPPEVAAAPATPWCTIPRALAVAPVGSAVILRAGTYPNLAVVNDTRRTDYMTIEGAFGEDVEIAGLRVDHASYLRLRSVRVASRIDLGVGADHIELGGLRMPNGITIRGGATNIAVAGSDIAAPCDNGVTFAGAPTTPELVNVSLRHNHLHNIGRDAIQATRFRDVLIEGNEIEGVSKCDPQEHPDVLQTFRDGDGLVFRGNFVHDNAAGILVSGGVVTGLAIENNVIVHQTDQYAAQFYNAPGVRITGNTVWDVRYGVNIESGTTQAVIVNNAFDFLRCTDKSRFQVEDHNLVGGGDFGGPHDRQTSTPGFVDPAKLRYDLAPGSPAIGAGTLDHGVLPTDVDGVPRPTDNPDIGAHQRIASPPGGRLPVAIERGAPYTRDPRVKLELGEAAALGARLEVRNGAGAPTPVPASRAIEWRLPSAPGHATVQQVAVTAFPAGQNGSAQILLDQARPVIRRARLRRSRTNGRPRRLTISARDEGSGLASIQVSARRSPRAPRIAFRRITKVMTAARSWVRVADRAGNLSPWQRVG